MNQWPSYRAPFSGNAAFPEPRFRPPLQRVWEFGVGKKHLEGAFVGEADYVAVPVGSTGVACLALRDGSTRWVNGRCRSKEMECYAMGGHLWSSAAGITSRRLSSSTGEETGRFEAPLTPKGLQGGKILLAEHLLDPETLEVARLEPGRAGRTDQGILYGTKRAAESPERDLAARDLESGQDLWSTPIAEDLRKESVLAVGEDTVVFHGEGRKPGKKWLVFRDRESGAERWRKETGDSLGQTWPIVISHGHVFRWDRSRLIAHDAKTGKAAWKFKGETRENSNLVLIGDCLYFGTKEKSGKSSLRALLATSGEPLWTEAVEGPCTGYALGAIGDSLVARIGKKVTCWRPGD